MATRIVDAETLEKYAAMEDELALPNSMGSFCYTVYIDGKPQATLNGAEFYQWMLVANRLKELKAREADLRRRLAQQIFRETGTAAEQTGMINVTREVEHRDGSVDTESYEIKAKWKVNHKLVLDDMTLEEFKEAVEAEGAEGNELHCFDRPLVFNLKAWMKLNAEDSPIEDYVESNDGLPEMSAKKMEREHGR